jgi:hypothetical protein
MNSDQILIEELLKESPHSDRAFDEIFNKYSRGDCNPWVYYLLDHSNLQHAVYEGFSSNEQILRGTSDLFEQYNGGGLIGAVCLTPNMYPIEGSVYHVSKRVQRIW